MKADHCLAAQMFEQSEKKGSSWFSQGGKKRVPTWMGRSVVRGWQQICRHFCGHSSHMSRSWYDLFDGESRGFLCLDLRSWIRLHDEAFAKGWKEDFIASMCLRCSNYETNCHSFRCKVDAAGGTSLSRCSAPTSQRWTTREDLEPSRQRLAWRTSRAAEYPTGLCVAWANSLNRWLDSEEDWKFLASKTFQFQLVRLDWLQHKEEIVVHDVNRAQNMTKIQKREWENLQCIVGLRDPSRPVAKCEALRKAGNRIRRCLDSCMTDCMLASVERKLCKDEDAVKLTQRAIAKEFGVNDEDIAESGSWVSRC